MSNRRLPLDQLIAPGAKPLAEGGSIKMAVYEPATLFGQLFSLGEVRLYLSGILEVIVDRTVDFLERQRREAILNLLGGFAKPERMDDGLKSDSGPRNA